jgi:predicted amidohydrolase
MNKTAESLTVTIIQSNLHWENKEANLAMFEQKIRSSEDKMEIVVLPEMFNTAFSMKPERLAETMEGATLQWMKRISSEKKIILTGSFIVEEDGAYFNRLIWMLPSGDYGYYDKRHLFAFAGEDEHYTGGNKRLIASVKGWRINLQICYDLRFPLWARQSVPLVPLPDGGFEKSNPGNDLQPEYDVLIYVANWPERRNHAWKTLLQARAIENQCYVVGVNRVGNDGNDIYYSGDSMIVDPMGKILYTSVHEEDIFTYTLTLQQLNEVRDRYPFLKDADPFIIGN